MSETFGATMPLAEFVRREKGDGNLFWRLSSGDHQNLLEEAVEHLEKAVVLIERLAGQQAMTDDWYIPELTRLRAAIGAQA